MCVTHVSGAHATVVLSACVTTFMNMTTCTATLCYNTPVLYTTWAFHKAGCLRWRGDHLFFWGGHQQRGL
ncbi:hypothetical protein FKM82_025081 [Ascaphus truei]